MKYKIVELNNTRFKVYISPGFLYGWDKLYEEFNSELEARKFIVTNITSRNKDKERVMLEKHNMKQKRVVDIIKS